MTNVQENLGAQRTRRNIMKMGAVLVAVVLARVKSAQATPTGCRTAAAAFGRCNCFLKGTKIETAEGARRIEDLAIGDLLPTMFGGPRPVQWIGRYSIKKSDPSKPWVKDALPVRIARSALAPNVPHADLHVTGGHSLFLDGLLVPVGNLINGTSIRRDERDCDELEFFHIKLESHDVIYAEGAPSTHCERRDESAVNFAEYFRRYGVRERPETPCAPRVTYGGGRGEFNWNRSAMSPWLDCRDLLTSFATA